MARLTKVNLKAPKLIEFFKEHGIELSTKKGLFTELSNVTLPLLMLEKMQKVMKTKNIMKMTSFGQMLKTIVLIFAKKSKASSKGFILITKIGGKSENLTT